MTNTLTATDLYVLNMLIATLEQRLGKRIYLLQCKLEFSEESPIRPGDVLMECICPGETHELSIQYGALFAPLDMPNNVLLSKANGVIILVRNKLQPQPSRMIHIYADITHGSEIGSSSNRDMLFYYFTDRELDHEGNRAPQELVSLSNRLNELRPSKH